MKIDEHCAFKPEVNTRKWNKCTQKKTGKVDRTN